ncbi:helix-turn-helix domain-containing protein [Persicitalea sp.]|uniref:helix-turn-helix domain-containing protein n=1 Tax=Persicitalea sp. TaxID=3100273 RepID=UPI0035947CB0
MISAEHTLLEKLDDLIDENLDDSSFSINGICETLGVSRSHLHRAVRDQTQNSTSRYIRQRRLLRAKELLMGTDLRISEICDAVGITNPQNFSTYFTEEFQVSPTQFRKYHTEPENLVAPPSVGPAARPARRRPYAVLAAIALLLIGAGCYQWFKQTSEAVAPEASSLAVLPFTNLGNTDSNPACESIMDDIYTSAALIDNLNVIARSSSDRFKGTGKGILQIGEELRVAHVLKGSFLRTDDQVQIKIDLVSTQKDGRSWTKNYHAAYKDIFQLTEQIVTDIARQLERTRGASAAEKLQLARTQNIEAYNAFLQGRQLMNTRTNADLLASIARFERAIALDSTFAEAYAYQAAAHLLLLGPNDAEAQKQRRLTEQTALNAIRLDPTNSTAYAVLGALYHTTQQWQASETAFRIALQHNPNDAQANYWYSLLLRSVGRVDEAVTYSTRAVTLDPLYPVILAGHILNCTYAGQFGLAKENIESGRVLFNNSFAYHMVKAYYSMNQADYAQAVAAFERGMELNPDDKGQIPLLMYCEAKRGNRQKADAFIQGLVGASPWENYQRAVVYAGLSKADSSLYYLKKAADGGYYFRDTKVIQVFEPYHSSLTFRAVLRRYNLAD